MYDFYALLKENINFNKFVVQDLLIVEYNCPLEEEKAGLWSRYDYIIHVLNGRKKWKTAADEEWLVEKGQTLYISKGAAIVEQYFDEGFCMLGFFITDDIIRAAFNESGSELAAKNITREFSFTAGRVKHSAEIDIFLTSMLGYFQKNEKPADSLLQLKAKELILALISSNKNTQLTSYLSHIARNSVPSLPRIMESNFCYNLGLDEFARLCHRSLSSFKRDFQKHFKMTPGKWLLQRRLQRAKILLAQDEENISQITIACGFENISHFSRSFKNEYGLSPSAYRNKIK